MTPGEKNSNRVYTIAYESSALEDADIACALHAAESLVTVAAERDTNESLLDLGAAAALQDALQFALDDSSDAGAPFAP